MDDDQGTDDQGFEPVPEKESVDPAQDGPDLFGGAPAAPREASSTVPPDAASDIAVHDAPIISADPTPVTDEEPPLALYRRYRPVTFYEVIGQEHVTEPLKRALI
ncbi:MAG: hypothetical protein KDB34_01030, partial [Propionibacteriaceae bacterium]|nr:hypothetical protein [Propionibacteriaceae bacterium]